ncbi:hypothetical protein DSO57_1038702 [Entomophthora muscae]|uniref:Uncharacterized protein n=1 Tax=Entomophthora muscae TaxID=34485 RepID=A0ACC2SBJ8_9FUNG|nr:hypothetical protein DSO57_1038702 [Entomophthora muscae]
MAVVEANPGNSLPITGKGSTKAQADLVRSITLKEIRATLKEAPKGKAPGPDNLPVETLKLMPDQRLPVPRWKQGEDVLHLQEEGGHTATEELEAHQPLKRGLQVAHLYTIK